MKVIKDKWQGRVKIPYEVMYSAKNPFEVCEHFVEDLVRKIREEVALECVMDITIDREDVKVEYSEDEASERQIINVEWHPDPERGAHFLGGSYDKNTLFVKQDMNGRAPMRVTLPWHEEPAPIYDSMAAEGRLPAAAPIQHESYRRLGINPETHRWVYEIEL